MDGFSCLPFIAVSALLFVFLWNFNIETSARRGITDLLTARGYRDIYIRSRLWSSERGTRLFVVEYTAHGERRTNRCIIELGLLTNGRMSWAYPLE